jgi:hypothetical protein
LIDHLKPPPLQTSNSVKSWNLDSWWELRYKPIMNLTSLTSASAWKAYALECIWRVIPGPATKHSAPSWVLPQNILPELAIQWPQTYDWKSASIWVQSLRDGLKQYVRLEPASIAQPFNHVVLFYLFYRNTRHVVCIDYSDHATIDPKCLGMCSLYFRMQYANAGYDDQKIVPGGYITYPALYDFLPYLRARDRSRFEFDAYGRFGNESAVAIRGSAIEKLKKQKRFQYTVTWNPVRYCRSLMEIARSKVCIDLPGQGSFCFRLVDYLAVGACIIAYPHSTKLPVPLVHGQHIMYTKSDLSDLEDICQYYVEHKEERERLAGNARDYFDKYLHKSQLACYYLHQMIARLCC